MGGPWEDFQPGNNSGPWEDFSPPPQKKSEPEGSTLADVGKQVLAGIPRGLAAGANTIGSAIAGAPARALQDIRGLITGQNQGPAAGTGNKALQAIEGALPQPQTTAGKYAGSIAETVANPTSYLGGGGLGAKVAGALGSGAGSQGAVQAFGEGPWQRLLGGLGGGLAGSARTLAARPPAAVAPSREAIKAAGNAAYKELDAKGIELRPDVVQKLAGDIHTQLTGVAEDGTRAATGNSFRARNQPGTFAAIEDLKQPLGKNYQWGDIDSVRQQLGHVIQDKPGTSDAAAAMIAREHIDEYVSNIPEVSKLAGEARGNWAAMKRAELLDKATERGDLNAATTGSGANIDNALRQRAKAILVNDKQRTKFNEKEVELLNSIARGDRITNIARLLSKLGPKHPLTGWGSALAADLGGHAGAGTATLGLGAIAQWLAERGTTSKMERLNEMTRARSPLGQSMPQPAVPQVGFGQALTGQSLRSLLSQMGAQNAKP